MDRTCQKCNHAIKFYMSDYYCKCSIVDWIDSIKHGFPEFWVSVKEGNLDNGSWKEVDK